MKVIYDDKCNICNKEIEFYQKLENKNIEWIGIHKDLNKLKNRDISKEKYLKKMHVVDDNGEIKVGVDAFILLWKKYKYFKYLATIVSFYPVKIFASLFYWLFAKYRYKKLYKSNSQNF